MTIFIKNKHTLQIDDFKFRCCIGKKGSTKNKKEKDKKTPKGLFELGDLFYRKDRMQKPKTKLNCKILRKNLRWCDNPNDKINYNKLITKQFDIKSEKLYRKDYKYDLLIPINFNTKNTIYGNGSAIFLHLTKNYQGTAGCVALNKKDFLILLKLINKKTKIKIY
jgi:L,D-peptidoglycan transpeptidase YkuD (ErfK/YbiS/YcfS/YnhG family)